MEPPAPTIAPPASSSPDATFTPPAEFDDYVIVRALGMKESVQVDILTEVPRVGDVYLLCSDGLTGMLTDAQVSHIIESERDLDRAVEKLIDAANEEGGHDNISAVMARIEAS